MTITRVSSGQGLPSGFPFSLASKAGGIVYISGMPALGADGKFQGGAFLEEADRAWAAVLAIAAASGCSEADLLFVQVTLADIGCYAELNDWWGRNFPDPASAPVRFTFAVAALPFGAKIEFQAVAAARS